MKTIRDVRKQPWQVATLIAELMRRAPNNRVRLSELTFKELCGRTLAPSMYEQVRLDLLDHGFLMHKLEPGGPSSGIVIIPIASLHAYKPVVLGDVFTPDEIDKIKNGTFAFEGYALGADDSTDL